MAAPLATHAWPERQHCYVVVIVANVHYTLMGKTTAKVWTIVVDHRGFSKRCGPEVFGSAGEFGVWLGD